MAVGDILELVLGMNQNGQKLINRIYYRQDTADGTNPPALDLKNAFVANVLPAYQAAVSDVLSFETIRIRRIAPTEGGSFVYTIDETGDLTGDPVPPNSVAIVALYPETVLQRFQSRIHVSGIRDDDTQNGVLEESELVLLNGLAAALVDQMLGAGGAPNWHAGMRKTTGDFWDNFVDATTRNHLYTLRSRTMENP